MYSTVAHKKNELDSAWLFVSRRALRIRNYIDFDSLLIQTCRPGGEGEENALGRQRWQVDDDRRTIAGSAAGSFQGFIHFCPQLL